MLFSMENYLYLFKDYQLCLAVLVIIGIIIIIGLCIIISLLKKLIKLFSFKFLTSEELKKFEKNIIDESINDKFNPKN